MPLSDREYSRMQDLRTRLNGSGLTDHELSELQGLLNRYKWLSPQSMSCPA